MTLLALFINILLLIFLPLLLLLFFIKKYKSPLVPFFWGFLTFFISQFLLRIPLLQLTNIDSLITSPFWLLLFLSFTAGLFEETIKYIFARTALKHKLSSRSALTFGLGHGYMEIILIVVLPLLSMFIIMLFLSFPNTAPLLAIDEPTKQLITTNFNSLTIPLISLSLWERACALMIHISITVIMFKYLNLNKKKLALLLPILLHTTVNFIVILLASYNIWLSEITLLFIALGYLFYAISLTNYSLLAKRRAK